MLPIFISLFSATVAFAQPEQDLVEVRKINPSIRVELRYAASDNFTGKPIYENARCLLRRAVAERLSRVQKRLEKQGFGLKIWDAYRPVSAQEKLWKVTPPKRRLYVSNPAKGSKHSRGAAVDLTLVDLKGNDLPMPTEYDAFTVRAQSNYSQLSKEVVQNRTTLHNAMKAEGFIPASGEWWHFSDPGWRKYPLLDLSFEAIR
ncbi:MAG: D-alanyl-D-alanine dipeptidase [Chlorobiales bacterium]|nr:D-alanyl-D-alanine dipeptidase [Chlorobiales bacterium]